MREATLALPIFEARFDRVDPDPVNRWTNVADGDLAAATLRGSPEAYGELVRRRQIAVYNVANRLVGQMIAVVLVAAWYLTQSLPDVLGPGWSWLAQSVTFVLAWIDALVVGFAPSLPDGGGEIPTALGTENLHFWGIIVLLLGALWLVGNRVLLADERDARRGEQGRS